MIVRRQITAVTLCDQCQTPGSLILQITVQHSVINQCVFRGRRLLIAGLLQRPDPAKCEIRSFALGNIGLINAKVLLNPLGKEILLQHRVTVPQKAGILLLTQAQIVIKCTTVGFLLMPCDDLLADGIKGTETANKPRPKTYSGSLPSFFFLPHGKLPIIDPLIVRVPCQTAALQAVTACHEIDLRCAFADRGVVIFIHILCFNDDLRTVGGQQGKQHVQLVDIVGPCRGSKRTIHQEMRHIRFQQSLCYIDDSCKRISHEMDGTTRGHSSLFGCRG